MCLCVDLRLPERVCEGQRITSAISPYFPPCWSQGLLYGSLALESPGLLQPPVSEGKAPHVLPWLFTQEACMGWTPLPCGMSASLVSFVEVIRVPLQCSPGEELPLTAVPCRWSWLWSPPVLTETGFGHRFDVTELGDDLDVSLPSVFFDTALP